MAYTNNQESNKHQPRGKEMNIDFEEMASDSKSHSADELRNAVKAGMVIWSLDSATSGNDDLLIYDPSVDEDQIMIEIEEFFGLENDSPFVFDQPNRWTLRVVDPAEYSSD